MDMTRRAFGLGSGALVVGLGVENILPMTKARASAAGTAFDPTPYVHPELRRMVGPLLQMRKTPLDKTSLAAFRKMTFTAPVLPAPAWVERIIPGPKGAPDLRIYIVNAKPGTSRPAILHTHGGGFIAGDAKGGLRTLQEIAQVLDCVAVSVDYRLAPETRFTGSLEDNYTGLKWLYDHAGEVGADRARIALYGESAGGGHAALLAIAARDRGEIPLSFQALVYPMLDDRTGSTIKKPPYMGAIVWTPEDNRFGWTSLLGVEAGSSGIPTAGVPARCANLKGLPPTFIAVGSIDLFVDEDVEYARRLLDSGIATELHVIPGAFHGFDVIPTRTLGNRFRATLIAAFQQAFNVSG